MKKWKELLIVIAVVALVMVLFGPLKPQRPALPSPTPAKGIAGDPRPTAVLELHSDGRPTTLDQLWVTAKFHSDKPVQMYMASGRPLGYLSIQVGNRMIDFAHYSLMREGKAPGTLYPQLSDEIRTVTDYEWEFQGRDLVPVSLYGREIIENGFANELQLSASVQLKDGSNGRISKMVKAKLTLPSLRR